MRVLRGSERGVGTVLFGAGGEVRGCCREHHVACLFCNTDEEVMYLLEIEVCHFIELEVFGCGLEVE